MTEHDFEVGDWVEIIDDRYEDNAPIGTKGKIESKTHYMGGGVHLDLESMVPRPGESDGITTFYTPAEIRKTTPPYSQQNIPMKTALVYFKSSPIPTQIDMGGKRWTKCGGC